MTQEELDAAYDQSVYASNMEELIGRLANKSNQVRDNLGGPARIQYGQQAIEALDIYSSELADSPVVIFIHGGSWQVGKAADNAFAAEVFVRSGINFVVPDFSPVDDFSGDLEGMIAQLQQAVTWIVQHAREFGGDPEKIYLAGFSSGAHLAGVLLTRDLPEKHFKGALLCSGMYDLTPVALSFRRQFVKLDQGNIPVLSPQANVEKITCPVLLAYGTAESPEFIRQGREFAAALQGSGHQVQTLVAENLNHFEIIETLGEVASPLASSFIKLIQKQKT